jgi:alpha-L-rhamnosidase
MSAGNDSTSQAFPLKPIPALLVLGALLAAESPAETTVARLRCEDLDDPSGIDVTRPRISWVLRTEGGGRESRGESQTAYQVLVASSASLLATDRGDLWDSGKIEARDSTHVEYRGTALVSRQQCFWKLRVWGLTGSPSAWSKPAAWTVGLLHPEDWQADWIADPILAKPSNRPRTPIDCYRSELSADPEAGKWIVFDLGALRQIDAVNLRPARPAGLNADIRTVQYPRRFRLEVADEADFRRARTIVDQTRADFPQPRTNDCLFPFGPVTARFVRLTVTRLGLWDARDFGVFLGPIQILSGKVNVAVGSHVTCSDSVESAQWSTNFLVDPKTEVRFSDFPPAIAAPEPGASPSRVTQLRRDFQLDADVRRATLYITARGFYEARINGQQVGDHLLAPGFTDYDTRIAYQSHEVTSLLHQGANTIGAWLGYGWYAGRMNVNDNGYIYGYFPQLLAQLEIELVDGRQVIVATDKSWETTLGGPVRWSDLLDGEARDFRREQKGWDQPGFAGTDWQQAWVQPRDSTALVWNRCPPVRAIKVIQPTAMWPVRPGAYLFDMGREFTGWCRVLADGPAGTRITLRHAEQLGADGSLDTRSLWGTPQRDDYILDGNGPQVLEPRFTYHGFRYVELSGLPGPPQPETLVGINIHTDLKSAGSFECSNELYNRLMNTSRQTQENLFFDVPTGCAARSERLAWTGDIRPCVNTVLFNYDAMPFLAKYLVDLRDGQKSDGRFTDICPHAHLRGTDICAGSPGWADAGVTLPWDYYIQTGDRRSLAQHYESARRWVDGIHANNPELRWANHRGQDWGDWMSAGEATPKEIGSTAFFAHSVDIVAKMAEVLGQQADAARYRQLFKDIREVFARDYVSPEGIIRMKTAPEGSATNDAQGSYALALQFDLLDEPLKTKALDRLAKVIERDGGHPTTGFWSSVELLLALSSQGRNAVASEMVNLRSKPSWGYMADHGTTFWESFDADTDSRALSLNHWTHSAVGEWLWRNVAGVSPDPQQPGYQAFTVQPRPTPEVNWCKATLDTVRGHLAIDWRRDKTGFQLVLTVPAGSVATVCLPTADVGSVTEGGNPIAQAGDIRFLRTEKDSAVFQVPAGTYRFQAR